METTTNGTEAEIGAKKWIEKLLLSIISSSLLFDVLYAYFLINFWNNFLLKKVYYKPTTYKDI